MTQRTFYKTVVQVTVLSEGELPSMDLDGIHEAITTGDCSGHVVYVSSEKLDGKQAVEALEEQASDSCFFFLTPEGEDINE
jgi:hypothetical protein